jgi:hypothetical protein
MSLFGFNQTRPVRMPSTQQGQVRVKRRHSNRPMPDSGRQGNDDIHAERSVHDFVDTGQQRQVVTEWLGGQDIYADDSVHDNVDRVLKVPEKVARLKRAERLTPSNPEELVVGQTKGSEDLSKQLATVEAVVHQKLDKLAVAQVDQTERMSMQMDAIAKLMQLVEQLVMSSGIPAVSATVEAVEKDTGIWGNVLAAGGVQAASKSELTTEPKDELRPRKKGKPGKVGHSVEVEKVEKLVRTDAPVVATKVAEAPLSFLS